MSAATEERRPAIKRSALGFSYDSLLISQAYCTASVKLVDAVVEPEVPVTVMV